MQLKYGECLMSNLSQIFHRMCQW